MPRHPLGDNAMTGAERQRRWRERLRKANPVATDRQKLAQARAEIGRLRKQMATMSEVTPPTDLSMTAAAKLEAAKRMLERRLNAEHAARRRGLDEEVRLRVLSETKEYLTMLKAREEEAVTTIATYREFTNNHKAIFTVDEFKVILMCLHPDGQRTTDKLNTAFRLFNAKKVQLTKARW